MAEILVIDDDPAMRRVISRLLGGAGHSVREAANGLDGIALFRQSHPALVITDIVMPHAEGMETIVALKRDEPTICILAISGHGGGPVSYLDLATKLGADAALSKPFAAADLLAAVEGLLANAPKP
jgi:CheY-like chemotaxis protein